MDKLRVKEIYRSIQGESTWAGWPCTFVRTAGCDIRCTYCDETHAFSGGELISIPRLLSRVKEEGAPLVEVTGGEPLLQKNLPQFVSRLLDDGHTVLIETGGHHDISVIDSRAHIILDIKSPGSGMHAHGDLANLDRLSAGDELKLVLCDRADYEWARDLVREHRFEVRIPIHFSPVVPGVDPQELARWILDDRLPVRLNLQLHKFIWGPDAKQV